MKKNVCRYFSVMLLWLFSSTLAWSQDISPQQMMEEIRQLKARITLLEEKLKVKTEPKGEVPAEELKEIGGVKSIKERLENMETRLEGIRFSGRIEVEAGYTKTKPNAGADSSASDIAVATAEFGVDAKIADPVDGHILLLYEEGNDLIVDEAIIHIHGEKTDCDSEGCREPWYLNFGRLYIPFGYYESHFVSDPLTLLLGETRESALVAGLSNDWANFSAGVFNGEINKSFDNDDHIDNYVASLALTLPHVRIGASYISNIAASKELIDRMNNDGDGDGTTDIKKYVGGYSAFVSVNLKDTFFLEAEYLAAADEFEAGELAFDGDRQYRPAAWNFEFAYAATDQLVCGLRYAGSDDGGDFLPEKQYGAVITYGIFENSSLALEYQHNTFENNDKEKTATAQFAVEF